MKEDTINYYQEIAEEIINVWWTYERQITPLQA